MRALTIGVSLKTYFTRQQARTWFGEVASRLRDHAGTLAAVDVFIIPTYLQIDDAVAAFRGTPVRIGAQDVSAFPPGPYTGEVSAAELAESGVTMVEIGHAERRRLFSETDEDTAEKAAAALTAGLTPVICVGEVDRVLPAEAAAATIAQLRADLEGVPAGPVIIAYEPVWAIGAAEPATPDHIAVVTRAVRAALDALPDRMGSAVIYGGSAGPGLLTRLAGDVDGLFLGRRAHDPDAFVAVLDEAAGVAASRSDLAM